MKPTSEPLVSIVTPVYNGENFLGDCIESILVQSYENWEYIIVNNCSTDRSLQVAERYAQKDTRIRIYNNKNLLPMLKNHNHALRQISSESKYCKIVHADDWLFPQCLKQMVKVADSHPAVGIVGSYSLVNTRVRCDGLPYPSTIVPGREICQFTLLGRLYVFWSPTSLLIRSELIRNRKPFYSEGYLYADVDVLYEILQHCDFGFVHQVLTYIRQHSESMTSQLAAPLNRIILSNFHLFTKYGPVYLSSKQYRKRLCEKLTEYYRFLAKSFFQLREKEFWDYHKEGVQNAGYPFSSVKLAKASFLELIERPKATLGLLARAIKRKAETMLETHRNHVSNADLLS